MALVGAPRSAVRMDLPCFCGNRGVIHMSGEMTHEAKGIGMEPCILKPEDPRLTVDIAFCGCRSRPSGGSQGLAFWSLGLHRQPGCKV